MADSQAQETQAESQVSVWKCTWRDPIQQPNEQPQVGDLLRMTCEGSPDQHFSDNVYFLEQEDAKHLLKVIKVNNSQPGSLDLTVTSYRPGEHKDVSLMFSDGDNIAKMEATSFNIQSVLPQDKQPEPYPYFGPFSASYPIWLWIGLAVILLAISYPIVRVIRKRQQKNKLVEASDIQMREQNLLHDMAKIYREEKRRTEAADYDVKELVQNIDKNLREYLVIRYKVPAFDWSRSEIIADLKKYHRKVYNKIHVPLNKLLFELSAAEKLDRHGCVQLLEDFRKFYELSEKAQKEVRS